MAARIVTVTPDSIWEPEDVERLWFFYNGSQYLRYSPHFHVIYRSGFRQNFPLTHMFVVVMEGKLSVKDYYGGTVERIVVRDQVWYFRERQSLAQRVYAMTVPGHAAYNRRPLVYA